MQMDLKKIAVAAKLTAQNCSKNINCLETTSPNYLDNYTFIK